MAIQTRSLEFNSEKITHYYLCNYRPLSAGLDDLSKSLLNFKRGDRLDTQAWIECALVELEKVQIPNGTILLRALTNNEEEVKPFTTLDELGRELAKKKCVDYRPALLKKIRKTKQVKLLSMYEREQELANAYSFASFNSTSCPTEILILDDILTTGTTMRAIVKAIRSVLTSTVIRIFTLASTDREALINKSVQLTGYNYGWENSKGWIAADDSANFDVNLEALKSRILNDRF